MTTACHEGRRPRRPETEARYAKPNRDSLPEGSASRTPAHAGALQRADRPTHGALAAHRPKPPLKRHEEDGHEVSHAAGGAGGARRPRKPGTASAGRTAMIAPERTSLSPATAAVQRFGGLTQLGSGSFNSPDAVLSTHCARWSSRLAADPATGLHSPHEVGGSQAWAGGPAISRSRLSCPVPPSRIRRSRLGPR